MSITMTDLFCGAGGSSTGADQVDGIEVKLAANHWPLAVETHQANHPTTDHDCADLSQVDPRRYHKTDILWASPECTNHSVAKGIARAKQVEANFGTLWEEPLPSDAAVRSRATMWDVPRFAEVHKYPIIITENVVDAAKWVMFPAWLQAMNLLGYSHHIVWLNSMHAQLGGNPAPQSRDRMYVVFWRGVHRPRFEDLRPTATCAEHGEIRAVQVFKKPEEWGRYRAQYVYRCPKCGKDVEPGWIPASAVIDWSNPGTRIGDRTKPLSPKTMKRIQAGIDRYWGNGAGDALLTRNASTVGNPAYLSTPVREPMRTLLAAGIPQSLLIPAEGREGKKAMSSERPFRTQSTRLETALLMPYYGKGTSSPTTQPHRTMTTADRYALIEGDAPKAEDCSFRMLTPDEVKRGMAFPNGYIARGNHREQVRMWGNAVTPPAARGLLTIAKHTLEAA